LDFRSGSAAPFDVMTSGRRDPLISASLYLHGDDGCQIVVDGERRDFRDGQTPSSTTGELTVWEIRI